jgi:hypothetical protein
LIHQHHYWTILDRDGAILTPEMWPSIRALRRETNFEGFEATLRDRHSGKTRALQISSMPLRQDAWGGVTLIQEIDQLCQPTPAENLKPRYSEAVLSSVAALIQSPESAAVSTILAALAGGHNGGRIPD